MAFAANVMRDSAIHPPEGLLPEKPHYPLAHFNLNREARFLTERTSIFREYVRIAPHIFHHASRTSRRPSSARNPRRFHTEYPTRVHYLLTSTHDFSANNSLSLLGNFSIVFRYLGVRGWWCAVATAHQPDVACAAANLPLGVIEQSH
ncbi:hypothetical protein P5V15_004180 [Pogonomyrmex californicus]